jgi:hypothetical protein
MAKNQYYEPAREALEGEFSEFDHNPTDFIRAMGWSLETYPKIEELKGQLAFSVKDITALSKIMMKESKKSDDLQDILESNAVRDYLTNTVAVEITSTYAKKFQGGGELGSILHLSQEVRMKHGEKGAFPKSNEAPTFQAITYFALKEIGWTITDWVKDKITAKNDEGKIATFDYSKVKGMNAVKIKAFFAKKSGIKLDKWGRIIGQMEDGGTVNHYEAESTVHDDGKDWLVSIQYNKDYDSTIIKVIDDKGYRWSIERVPFAVADKLYSMLDKFISATAYGKYSNGGSTEKVELVVNGNVVGVFSSSASAELYAKSQGYSVYQIFPLGTLLKSNLAKGGSIDRLWNFTDWGTKSFRQLIDEGKFSGKYKSIENASQFDRIKYNRMLGKEQAEYVKKLNRKVIKYNLRVAGEDSSSYNVSKEIYDYANLPELPEKNYYQHHEEPTGYIFDDGGKILNVSWTQELQRAFDVGQETHDLWDVELDRSDDDNVKLIGNEEQVERMYDYLYNSRVLANGGEILGTETIEGVKHERIKGKDFDYHTAKKLEYSSHPLGTVHYSEAGGNYGYVQSGYDWLRFSLKDLPKFYARTKANSDLMTFGVFTYDKGGENEIQETEYYDNPLTAISSAKSIASNPEYKDSFVEVWEKDREGLWGNTGAPLYKSDSDEMAGGGKIGKGKEGIGIDFQSDFSFDEMDSIEESVWERVADMVKEGYTSGELHGEEPDYSGWWEVHIEEDENDEEIRNEEVAKKIREGYTSGYYPTFSWRANVWKNEQSGGTVDSTYLNIINGAFYGGNGMLFMSDLEKAGFNPEAHKTDSPFVFRVSEWELHRPNFLDARYHIKKLPAGGSMATGGVVESLEKELRKLQRDLNSSRLRTYKEGDTSEEEMARQRERASKLARFDEVLQLLREKSSKYAIGGGVGKDIDSWTDEQVNKVYEYTFEDYDNKSGLTIKEKREALKSQEKKFAKQFK